MTKEYRGIRDANPTAFIGQCSFLLENRMQCPKGADWVQVDKSTDPPTETQYCRYHAVVLMQTENLQGVTEAPAPKVEEVVKDVNEKSVEKLDSQKENKPEPKDQTKDVKQNVNTSTVAKP